MGAGWPQKGKDEKQRGWLADYFQSAGLWMVVPFGQRDDCRELVARDVGQWQRAAGDANAEVEVVAALVGLGQRGRDVHRDFE